MKRKRRLGAQAVVPPKPGRRVQGVRTPPGRQALVSSVSEARSRRLSEQATYSFGSNNLRFGVLEPTVATSGSNSLEPNGDLKQPFYWNGAEWRKLTFSSKSLDFVIKAGGSAFFPPTKGEAGSETDLSGSKLDLTGSATVDDSGLTAEGHGTLIISQSVDQYESAETNPSGAVGATLHITRVYTIADINSNSATMTVKVRAEGGSVANVRVWMGTGDDYVGGTDGPTKEIGDFDESGTFVPGDAGGKTIRVSTSEEGVFFTTPSDGAAVQESCCSFDNVVNTDPAAGAASATGDGSYGIYFSFGDVADGEEMVAMAAYAAGSLADLAAVGTNLVESVAAAESAVAGGRYTP